MAERNDGIPVIGPLLNKIIGTRNERFVKRYTQRVQEIGAFEPEIRALSDAQIREKIKTFRERHEKGEKADELMVEAFAVAREAMDRSVGIRNIFNPEVLAETPFPVEKLSDGHRALYEQTKASMDASEPREAVGDLLGNAGPVPAYVWHDVPLELYEAVREIYPQSRPPFRARPFDVQLIGAMVLYQGKIAEMKTGEGKTIVGPLAAFLAAAVGEKVHVVTVNDYLVQRDRDWTFPFFYATGLTVGAIHPQHSQPEPVKRDMYKCDIVYGTTSEFGFDYLRDNMKRSVEQQVQRRRDFAIVDEVDSTLIDEARTPLIISGQAHDSRPRYELADQLASQLVEKQKPWQERDDAVTRCQETIKGFEGDIRQAKDKAQVPEIQKRLGEAKKQLPELEAERDRHTQYYEQELDKKRVYLTHDGVAEAQRLAGVGSFYVGGNTDIPHLLENALRAHVVYQRDRDYVVMPTPDAMTGRNEPSVVIVDQNTGRAMIGRQWSDGLHQAIECKEQVRIKEETQTVATITIQNFFKMYKRLAGMTGTADTEAQEFHDIYSLDVVSIPTNRPIARRDFDDLMYLRFKDKLEGIVDEIRRFHDIGRPVLVGTTSVERSETISQVLGKKYQIKHEVLNAKQHEREANIVADAGQVGAVVIATNMAGRGTDIKLGKISREQLVEHWLRRGIAGRGLSAEMTVEQLRDNVYRKVATGELGIPKREAESMAFDELELRLLKKWAVESTWLSEKEIEQSDADGLREELDQNGRCLLHRIRWFDSVEDMGGLHVIGTERHESRRIDNQLRGRSGRQGDNGSSRFFVSLEDDLMKMFAGQTTQNILARLGMKEGDAIEHPMLSKSVERAQRKVEERNFQVRKNILEYDEVMEHQRQTFYGVRQRVIEGRNVKGLVLGYVEDSITDACNEYLDPNYPAQCAADFAREHLDTEVTIDRLKGRDANEMDLRIREDAKAEARSMIDVTLGEYVQASGSDVVVDFDSAGLSSWAKAHFGVELDIATLSAGDISERRAIQEKLVDAAEAKIDAADLSRLDLFCAPHYGVDRLLDWSKAKFNTEVDRKAIIDALEERDDRDPAGILFQEVKSRYEKREVEYPAQFAMQMTMMLIRQDPQEAMRQLSAWTKKRLGHEWDPDEIRKAGPQKVVEELRRRTEEANIPERIEKGKAKAAELALDRKALEAHFEDEYDAPVPEWIDWLDEKDRIEAAKGLVDAQLRSELLQLERSILLETLDSSWKDHLYGMDQLRDGIGYQAFAQTDPRIAYKKEGSKLLNEMLQHIRDRVADSVLKAQFNVGGPGGGAGGGPGGGPGGARPARPASAPAAGVMSGQAPGANRAGAVGGGGGVGGSITGPMI